MDRAEELRRRKKELLEKIKEFEIKREKLKESERVLEGKYKFGRLSYEEYQKELNTLCKYLKENKKMKLTEIAKLLERDQRTVWVNYANASLKMKEKIKSDEEALQVSVKVFSDRRLSILESLVSFLRERGMRNSEIAKLLDKDARNVWTLYSRAVRKLKR